MKVKSGLCINIKGDFLVTIMVMWFEVSQTKETKTHKD